MATGFIYIQHSRCRSPMSVSPIIPIMGKENPAKNLPDKNKLEQIDVGNKTEETKEI